MISNVWYFELILEHIVFICHTAPSNVTHVSAVISCVRNDFKSLLVWSSVIQCMVPSSSASIYKVGKCMMPNVLKSVQILKLINVF